jgi:hypothetical protein
MIFLIIGIVCCVVLLLLFAWGAFILCDDEGVNDELQRKTAD